MKKLLLSIFAIASLTASATGTTIGSSELNWTIGNAWYMEVTTGKSIADFASSGTGVSWDFTSYEGASTKDTIKISAATVGGANLSIKSDIIPNTNYISNAGDYEIKSFNVMGLDVSMNGSLTIGLDHFDGASWNPSTTTPNLLNPALPAIPTTLTGSVLASGQVTTSYGTFDALLVKEQFVITGYVDMTFYYWETAEYGRIATLIDGSFSLMAQNNFNVITSSNNVETSSFNVFPNPATDNFTVQTEGLENVRVFDALGNLVINQTVMGNTVIVDTKTLNAGVYFVQATSNGVASTSRVIVK